MDIAALSTTMCQQQLMNNVNLQLMNMAMDSMESTGDSLGKSLELSVQPNLGQNIDITV